MKNNFLSFFPINFHIALAAPSKTYILLLNVNTNSHNNNRIDNREYETVFIIPGPNQDSNCKRTSKSFQICFVCFDFFRLFQLECEYLCLVLSNFRSEIVLDCYLGDFEFFLLHRFIVKSFITISSSLFSYGQLIACYSFKIYTS